VGRGGVAKLIVLVDLLPAKIHAGNEKLVGRSMLQILESRKQLFGHT
jgi:hypothetical protein